MTGAVTWEVLIFILSLVGGAIGVSTWLIKQIAGVRVAATKQIAEFEDKSSGEISKLHDDLAAHKLYAANHYATREGVNKELDRMSLKLDRIDSKIDRVLEK